MILVPLFTPPSDPQGWHQVTAPGGYEWWGVDAQDAIGRLRITTRFYHGYPFHPAYARRYARYLRRPTINLPPTPDQFPCVHFAVYEDQKLVVQFLSQYQPDALAAATDRLDVKIGPNHLRRGDGGSMQLTISNRARPDMTKVESETKAALALVPTVATSPLDGLTRVSGTIELGASDPISGAVGRRLTFTGSGFCRHQFGTTSPVFTLSREASGHLFLDGRAYVFQIHRTSRHWQDQVRLWEVTAAGSTELSMSGIRSDWNRRTSLGVAYSEKIECLPHVRLSSPRVVSSSLGSAQLVYQAQVDGSPERKLAWCEVVMPARVACPLMGRWIGRSIQQIANQT